MVWEIWVFEILNISLIVYCHYTVIVGNPRLIAIRCHFKTRVILVKSQITGPLDLLILHYLRGVQWLIDYELAVCTLRIYHCIPKSIVTLLSIQEYILDIDCFFCEPRTAFYIILVKTTWIHQLPEVRPRTLKFLGFKALMRRQYHLEELLLQVFSLLRVTQQPVDNRYFVLEKGYMRVAYLWIGSTMIDW